MVPFISGYTKELTSKPHHCRVELKKKIQVLVLAEQSVTVRTAGYHLAVKSCDIVITILNSGYYLVLKTPASDLP